MGNLLVSLIFFTLIFTFFSPLFTFYRRVEGGFRFAFLTDGKCSKFGDSRQLRPYLAFAIIFLNRKTKQLSMSCLILMCTTQKSKRKETICAESVLEFSKMTHDFYFTFIVTLYIFYKPLK